MVFERSRTKADAIKRIGEALGYDFPLYIGSSVPTELFTAASRHAHVVDEGSMPIRAERVVNAAGLQWTSDCDSRNTPSGGGATVTLTGLNRLLEALLVLGLPAESAVSKPEDDQFGREFTPYTGSIVADPASLVRDWNALDEATKEHSRLEASLADYVSSFGIQPRSPRASEPQFDLAWRVGDTSVIVEVKSIMAGNHRQQTRLGIGQVLEYVAVFSDNRPADYRAVLLLGEPPDPIDDLLAIACGVLILGEERFLDLNLEGLLP